MQASPSRLQLFLIHSPLELVDTTTGIDQFLLACEERMAFRTDIDVKVCLDGSSFESFTAGTFDNGLAVLGMNSLFHIFHLSKVTARILAESSETYAVPESVVAQRFYIT